MTEFRKLSERIGKDIYGQAFFAHLCSYSKSEVFKYSSELISKLATILKQLRESFLITIFGS